MEEDFPNMTYGFHGWMFLEKFLGRLSVIKGCSRAYTVLWYAEGLAGT